MGEVTRTPQTTDALGQKAKVLCIFGSESGNAKRGIDRWVKKWQAHEGCHFQIGDIMSGNEVEKKLGGDGNASAKNLEWIAQNYDVLLVCTSSYGDGDPPSNMRQLTKVLQHEASMKSDALKGIHHAVLGFGSTTYTTFQNVPRLTDKFLGECGSRRLVMRAEIDEHDPNPGEEAEYHRWGEEVFAALQALPAVTAPPACAWSKPADAISMLSEDDDDDSSSSSGGRLHPIYVATAALFAVTYGTFSYVKYGTWS